MFRRATKKQRKAKIGLYGPSGSGKTFTALRIARGLVGKTGRIALIDTEHASASIYADRFEFDALDLPSPNIEQMLTAIEAAMDYDVLIVDSSSHVWQELLGEVDRLAQAKYRGNTWSAWSEGTPKQRRFIEAMMGFPGHLICTMRAKTEWQTESTGQGNGKSKPVRVGLAPEQGKNIEYEFDLLISITAAHIALVEKDRTGKWQDAAIDKPGEKFGEELAAWLSQGEAPPPAPVADELLLTVLRGAVASARDTKAVRAAFDKFANESPNEPTMEAAKAICRHRHDSLEAAAKAVADAERAKREAERPAPNDDYAPPIDEPHFSPEESQDTNVRGAPGNSRRRQSAQA